MEVGKEVSKTRPDVAWSPKHDHVVLVGRVEEFKTKKENVYEVLKQSRKQNQMLHGP